MQKKYAKCEKCQYEYSLPYSFFIKVVNTSEGDKVLCNLCECEELGVEALPFEPFNKD